MGRVTNVQYVWSHRCHFSGTLAFCVFLIDVHGHKIKVIIGLPSGHVWLQGDLKPCFSETEVGKVDSWALH